MPVLTVKAQGWERPALVMDSHAIVAEVYTTTGRENQQQTAALFAAAPDLLKALQSLADAVKKYTATPEDWPELADARAAIAQAKGA